MNKHFPSSSRGQFHSSPRFCSVIALGVLSLCAAACARGDGGEDPAEDTAASATAPLFRAGTAKAPPEKVELVFQSRVEETGDKEIVRSAVVGELDVEQRDRVARPYRYVNEASIYSEEAWSRGS
ncbi:MAG: hypothetical protein ABI134_03410, partial [Byssovorax sp.]